MLDAGIGVTGKGTTQSANRAADMKKFHGAKQKKILSSDED